MFIKNLFSATGLLLSLACAAPQAQALELVTNGSFSSTTNGTNKQVGYNTNLTGWSVPSGNYSFVFSDISATVSGNSGPLSLWNGSNGGSALASNSPTGGNFFAADPVWGTQGPLTQTLTNLAAGTYQVSFDWAAAQQYGYTGDTWESWTVKLGSAASQSTVTFNNPSHGFTGWKHETMTFTVGAGNAVLSFLAGGGPNGVPPFALLDSVSVTAVPEPSTFALFALGLGAVVAARRKTRSAK
ncbi:PEP-CTERM sorting domain-containing protein [Paucibacter sp. KBW04]|uniref:PEP-CTERM sorting domain-containing protein n=1 Tax=Paucibacter sp. KBW04 TaxID=2153361 RepID=UPI001E53DC8C|nr:PEP-CTERM sorting domain-containing protein [Paucibacter sp. KBW04]